jgi:hypothetical protein
MTTNLRLLALLGIAVGLLGGAGIYFASAADDPAQPMAKGSDPKHASVDGKIPPAPANLNAEKKPGEPGAAALLKPYGKPVPEKGIKMQDLLATVEDQTGLIVRVDVAAFRRIIGPGNDEDGGFSKSIYSSQAILPRKADKLPIGDVLADALAQVHTFSPCTYQVRGAQLVIVPAYVPPSAPGYNILDSKEDEPEPLIPVNIRYEQIYGGVVNISAERQQLADILADLRKQTGANIVLDPRQVPQNKEGLTITLNDVRLYDALRVIADMSEMKMVYAGNIYYITTPANARQFQPSTSQRSPGTVTPPQPAPEKK